MYELYYSQWSEAIHGDDALGGLLSSGEARPALRPVRFPDDLEYVAMMATTIAQDVGLTVVDSLVPEHLNTWKYYYLAHIRPEYLKLMESKRLNVV